MGVLLDEVGFWTSFCGAGSVGRRCPTGCPVGTPVFRYLRPADYAGRWATLRGCGNGGSVRDPRPTGHGRNGNDGGESSYILCVCASVSSLCMGRVLQPFWCA